MKVLLLNGSPKPNESASLIILDEIAKRLGSSNELVSVHAIKTNQEEFLKTAVGIDALVVAFPLYVDGIPSHVLRLLYDIKDRVKTLNPEMKVYAIVNNGFYDARQNCLAIEMVRHFCVASGIKWGQGLGVGGGGMVSRTLIGKGPLTDLGLALDKISAKIGSLESGEDTYVEPNFPKFLYRISAHFGWRSQAKKNGVKRKEIYRQR